MKKILFPTDFSSQTVDNFKYAIEIAHFTKSKLSILHATHPRLKQDAQISEEEKMNSVLAQMEKLATTAYPDLYKSVKIEHHICNGFAVDVILDVSEEEQVDLIIMGMRGKQSGLDKLLGKITSKVIDNATCPVLLIPEDAKTKGIDEIIFPVNFEFNDFGVINFMRRSWCKSFSSPLRCVHVIEDQKKNLEIIQKINIIHNVFKSNKNVSCKLLEGDYEWGLSQFCKGKDADLLVTVSSNHNWVQKLFTEDRLIQLASELKIPLLVINEGSLGDEKSVMNWLENQQEDV